ncbi:unnamed protein product [Aphanomyces euteiches]
MAASKSSRSSKTLGKQQTQNRPPSQLDNDNANKNQSTHEDEPVKERKVGKLDLVVEEICTTEATDVKGLITLVESYVKPMQEAKHPIMENTAAAVFFTTLHKLVTLNSTFLEELMQVTIQEEPGNDVTERVADLFNRYIPLFTKVYTEYAKFLDDFSPLVNEYRTQSKEFTAMMDQYQRQCGSNQNFESFLILPIQRIPRYSLLLQRVMEYTQKNHPDLASLEQAVESVGKATQLMNETLQQKEKMEEVLKIQAQFAGQVSLFTLDRRLIKSGVLVKLSTKRKDKVMIHLFNDLLLYSDILAMDTFHARRTVDFHSKACRVDATLPASYSKLYSTESIDCGFMVFYTAIEEAPLPTMWICGVWILL